MSHLNDLVGMFKETNELNLNLRLKLVLEMIEYSITYPPKETIEPIEIASVTDCVHAVIKQIEDAGKHLLADRIHKIWKKRGHLLQIATNAHHLKQDYMDDLEYHEEIMWLRTKIEELN